MKLFARLRKKLLYMRQNLDRIILYALVIVCVFTLSLAVYEFAVLRYIETVLGLLH